ncbi:MAG: hypothetical protein QOJ79_3228 [Actinomycetota bacterium]|nr:hypothetical protein [Actinomycetota bacterium]
MSSWLILSVPGTFALLGAVLWVSAVAEQHFLSPRSLILSAARARRSTPEFTEEFVAKQFDRLLREAQR